jgi:hypothetical protein
MVWVHSNLDQKTDKKWHVTPSALTLYQSFSGTVVNPPPPLECHVLFELPLCPKVNYIIFLLLTYPSFVMTFVNFGTLDHEEESVLVLAQHFDRHLRHLRQARLALQRVVHLALVLILHVVPTEQT